jgi:hypothetical protein
MRWQRRIRKLGPEGLWRLYEDVLEEKSFNQTPSSLVNVLSRFPPSPWMATIVRKSAVEQPSPLYLLPDFGLRIPRFGLGKGIE